MDPCDTPKWRSTSGDVLSATETYIMWVIRERGWDFGALATSHPHAGVDCTFLKQEHRTVLHFDFQLHVTSSTYASGIGRSLVQTAVRDSASFQVMVETGGGDIYVFFVYLQPGLSWPYQTDAVWHSWCFAVPVCHIGNIQTLELVRTLHHDQLGWPEVRCFWNVFQQDFFPSSLKAEVVSQPVTAFKLSGLSSLASTTAMKYTRSSRKSVSLHMPSTRTYHLSAALHTCRINLVSTSSWFHESLVWFLLLVDLWSVALMNPPPVTISYRSDRHFPLIMIASDKNQARSALFSSKAMKVFHTCGSGTCGTSISLRIGF